MSMRLCVSAALVVCGSTGAVRAGEAEEAAADRLAALIDQHLLADWHARGIRPAAPADDAEFLRRVYLDLIGRAPKGAEAQAFLDDPDPARRVKLVERLLNTPSHAAYFASVTRSNWLPQSASNIQFAGFGIQVETWLRTQFQNNTPADDVVRRLLTVKFRAPNANRLGQQRFVQGDPSDPDSIALASFYSANEGKPENAGAAVSRLFLGVKLECAQCHDHPFAPYTKEQFWEFAAFFAELNPLAGTRPSLIGPKQPQSDLNRLTIPNTDQEVVARFFDGGEVPWSEDRTPRQELADWLVSPQNAYFSRNLANRMWAHFFGIGILDPVDEPGENNAPSLPALFDELGQAFAEGQFDNRLLIRAITRSRAYQLSSKLSHPTQADARRFARMNVKALSPAQLFDTLVAATGFREPAFNRNNQFAFNANPANPRSLFLTRFASNESRTESHTTILQALMLMNGQFIGDQTDLEKSEVLAAIADMPGWDTDRKVEAIFLTALSRRPTPAEAEKFASYIDRGGPNGNKKQALADVFWVVLNSPEFLFNH